MSKQWALVSRRDEHDRLTSSWEQIPVEERPYASDPWGELFRKARVAAEISLGTFGLAIGLSPVQVSRVERGAATLTGEDRRHWFAVLRQMTGETS